MRLSWKIRVSMARSCWGAPITITATGFPIGDIALGDCDTVFVERADNSGMGNVVAEHAVDHVAEVIRKTGDFAVASFGPGGACNWLMVGSGLDVRCWALEI